jgi:hypothetical protein
VPAAVAVEVAARARELVDELTPIQGARPRSRASRRMEPVLAQLRS